MTRMDNTRFVITGLMRGGQRTLAGVVAATLMLAQMTLPPQVEASSPIAGPSTWTLAPTVETTARFVYDGDGGRVKQITAAGTTTYLGESVELAPDGTMTLYLFVGAQRIAALTRTLEELHAARSPPPPSSRWATLWRQFLTWLDMPSADAATLPAGLRFYHPDHLGSTNVITDSTGAVVEQRQYTPYGSVASASSLEPGALSPFGFTGQRWDSSTGLYFYHSRYYDPQLGRFLQPDTIVQAPGDPQNLNRYAYARNNPLRYTDPSGHWSWSNFWKSFAGAFLGAFVTVITGGLGAPLWFAGMLGGISGGALTGGLQGGWKGALIGAGIGGALGGVGGWGVAQFGAGFGVGMLAAGAGVAGATGNWDSFAGGLTGGFMGAGVGNGVDSALHDHFTVTAPDAAPGGVRNEVIEGRGILTTPEKALQVANETGSRVGYTQSRGLIADLVRGGIKLAFRNTLSSREMAQFMLNNPTANYSLHSEATLTALGAAKMLGAAGHQLGGGVNLVSPFYSEATAKGVFEAIGMTVNWNSPHIADSAGMFTTFNPVAAVTYGTAGVVTLEHFHGYETYYPSQ